jgi:RNA polymerase sigma factor (sigma-70 family)
VVRTNPLDGVEDAELARRAMGGDGEAFGTLFERWFDRVFDVAWHIVHNRDTAAEVAQEAFATAWQQRNSLRQPESFGGWLLRIARNRGLNRLEREGRSRPLGDEETLVALDTRTSGGDAADQLIDRERDDLVWAASAALGEDDASLLNLHLRHELKAPELAEELGVEPNAAHQRLFRLKKRLADAVGAWVLWRRGAPACAALGTALTEAGLSAFDRAAATAIAAHAKRCEECDEARQLQLRPEALFAAVPLVPAGSLLKTKAAAALSALDVPVPKSPTALPPKGSPDALRAEMPAETTDDPLKARRGGHKLSRLPKVPLAAAAVALILAMVASLLLVTRPSGDGIEVETSASGDASGGGPPADLDSGDGGRSVPRPPPPDKTTDEPDEETDDPTGSSVVPPPTSEPPADGGPGPGDPLENPPPSTTSSTTTTSPPADPPVIQRFTGTAWNVPCSGAQELGMRFTWASSGGSSATLGPVGGPAERVEPSGGVDRCAGVGSTWELVVTGSGGQTRSTTTVG